MHFMSAHKEREIGPANMTAVAATGTHLFVRLVSLVTRCYVLVTQFYIYLRSWRISELESPREMTSMAVHMNVFTWALGKTVDLIRFRKKKKNMHKEKICLCSGRSEEEWEVRWSNTYLASLSVKGSSGKWKKKKLQKHCWPLRTDSKQGCIDKWLHVWLHHCLMFYSWIWSHTSLVGLQGDYAVQPLSRSRSQSTCWSLRKDCFC